MKQLRSIKIVSLGAAILMGLLAVMAACGGGDSDQETSTAATTQPAKQAASTTTTSTTAAAKPAAKSTSTTAQPSPASTANVVINVSGTPVYGGMIRRFGFGDYGVFDPQHAEMRTSMMAMVALQPLYETILSFDEPFDPSVGAVIVPNLAKDFSFSSDGLKLTVHLREGIKWHDGVPFTSADVQATFDRIMDPDVQKAPYAEASVPII